MRLLAAVNKCVSAHLAEEMYGGCLRSSVKCILMSCSKNATAKLQSASRMPLSEIRKFTASPVSLSWELDFSDFSDVCWSLVLSLSV